MLGGGSGAGGHGGDGGGAGPARGVPGMGVPWSGGARRAPLRASERRVAGVVLCEGLAAPVLGRFTAKVLFDCLFLWK